MQPATLPYRILRSAAGYAAGSFYQVRRWHHPAAGAAAGPLVVVANHPNAGIDPVLLATSFERPLRFLAKASLFQAPVLGTALRMIGALPTHRRADGADMAANAALFDSTRQALLAGDALCVFPEGTSHSDPSLRELRTGAARIVLSAVAAGADVRVLPVGLFYPQRERFRSEVSVWVGAPLAVRDWLTGRNLDPGRFDPADPELVRELTAAVTAKLDEVTFTAPADDLLDLARDIAAAHPVFDAARPDSLTWWSSRLTVAETSAEGRAATDALAAFFEHANEAGLQPDDLAGDRVPHRGVVVLDAARAVLVLPVAAAGAVLYSPAFQATHAATALAGKRGVGAASVKVAAGAALYPIWAFALYRLLQRRLPGAVAAAGVVAGWSAHLAARPVFSAEGRRWRRHLLAWRLRRSPGLRDRLSAAGAQLDVLLADLGRAVEHADAGGPDRG